MLHLLPPSTGMDSKRCLLLYSLFFIGQFLVHCSWLWFCCLAEFVAKKWSIADHKKSPALSQASQQLNTEPVPFWKLGVSHHALWYTSNSLFSWLIHLIYFHSYFAVWSNFGSSARRRSQPQNGRSRLPMARCSFGCSLDNILTSFTDDFFCFSFSSEPRLICRTVQGVLLRQRHSGSNTNHLGSLSNGESCIHLSPFLLCCYF